MAAKRRPLRKRKPGTPPTRAKSALSQGEAERLREGIRLHRAGNLQQAAMAYEQVLAQAPDNPDANHLLGVVAHQAGQLEIAVELIEKAIEQQPENPDMLCNLGNAQKALGDFDKAESAYRDALDIAPEDHEIHNNLGNLLADSDRVDAAETCYRAAIDIAPEFPQAHNNLGVVLKKQGDLETAQTHFETALEILPAYADAANNLGDVMLELGRPDAAREQYGAAVAADPQSAEAHNNLATALQTAGDMKGAIEHLETAIRLNPEFHEALYNLGHLLENQGRSREAVACYQDAFRVRTGKTYEGDKELAPGTLSLFMELTNKCNFHCEFCPSDSQKRAIGFMDLDLAKRLIDETAEKKLATQILLHLMGEPTLHPKLDEILAHAAGRDLKTELVTNGSALVAKTIPRILDNLYGTVIASLMTPTEESYETRGDVGLKWDRYVDNFRLLLRHHVERLAAGGAERYAINIRVMVTNESRSTVDFLESADEVEAIWRQWCGWVAALESELGIAPFPRPEIDANAILKATGSGASPSYPLQRGLDLTFWSAFTFANTRVGEGYVLHQDETQRQRFCKHPWLDIGVLWNGDVTFCCMDYDANLKIGNIGDSGLEAVIASDGAANLRKSMFSLDTLPDYCRQCQARPVLPGESTDDPQPTSSDARSQ
jgi:radical SAM protein with 4Fe4S-binding SPASM domain